MNYEKFYAAVCETVEKFEASQAANKELDAYLLALLRLLEARGSESFSSELMLEILSAAFESERAKFDEAWLSITRAPELANFCESELAGGRDTLDAFADTQEAVADIMRRLPEGFEIKFGEAETLNLKARTARAGEVKFTRAAGESRKAQSRNLDAQFNEADESKFKNDEGEFARISKRSGLAYSARVIKFQLAELAAMRSSGQLASESKFFGIVSPSGHDWYNFDPFSLLECGARGLMDHAGEDAPVRGGWEMLGELLETGRTYE